MCYMDEMWSKGWSKEFEIVSTSYFIGFVVQDPLRFRYELLTNPVNTVFTGFNFG